MAARPTDLLDPRRTWWVPAVIAPGRGWAGVAGCHKGSRYLLDTATCGPTRANYPAFASRSECLEWVMHHRAEIAIGAPGAVVRPVDLSRWMLGLD
ncbi:MAG: hypothetical protein LH610_10675 [Sphingomonas bacterium]|nr:hypothetical protein [Sphingomonas bacterium]